MRLEGKAARSIEDRSIENIGKAAQAAFEINFVWSR